MSAARTAIRRMDHAVASSSRALSRPATSKVFLRPTFASTPCALHRQSTAPFSPILRRCYATSAEEPTTAEDPALTRSQELIEMANQHLESGDLENAQTLLKQSVEIKGSGIGYFNLGVCEYQLKNIPEAISAWEQSIKISPSPDAYTNLASAYILSQPPQPALAITNLTQALELSPDDPEIAFNLGAILELTDNLEPALTLYQKAQKGGIDRAEQNIRNIGAKLLKKKAEEEGVKVNNP